MPDLNDSQAFPPPAEPTNGVPSPVRKMITIEIPADGRPSPPHDARGGDGDSILMDYLWRIGRHKWKILGFVTVVTFFAAYISSRQIPIYQSTAMIEVDRGAPAAIIGQDSQMAMATDTDQFLATQMNLIISNSVLRPVVEQYDPERRLGNRSRSTPEGPAELANLAVTRPPTTHLIQVSYRHPDRQMAASVANAVVESYIQQMYDNRYRAAARLSTFMEKQMGELRIRMEKSGSALAAFEREFQLINPEEKTSIVSSRLLQLNTEYTAAQADRVRKETAYDSVKAGSPDAAFVSSQGAEMKKLQERLNDAQEKFVQVKTQVGMNHPDYRQAASLIAELTRQTEELQQSSTRRAAVEYQESLAREQMLREALADTKNEFDQLNARSVQYKALKQDAESDKKLYDELILKIQESSINSGFQGSWIRLADPALPAARPVHHSVPMNMAVAFLLSAAMAIGVVLVTETLNHSVRDPMHVTQMGSRVLGSLPLVRPWKTIDSVPAVVLSQNGSSAGRSSAFRHGVQKENDANRVAFDEAVRWIRESILLSDPRRPIRTLLVTSASAREGKSTFAARLAIANAMLDMKTLMIDADLRHPSAHVGMGLDNSAGLSDVIRMQRDWKELLQKVPGVPSLEFLAAGPPSHRVFDQLGGALEHVLEHAYNDYSLIVIDSAPVLQFAEPLKAASLADGVVVLTRANHTDRKALQSVLTVLGGVNARVTGVVLNQVDEQDAKKYYYPPGVVAG
jgi:polysaccharide biosynthesis transport protein